MAVILIVEDDLATSEFFAELLEWNDYQPHVVATGAEALTAVAQHPVDAVLLDRGLPDISGIEVCRRLRVTIGDDVPIVLCTADYGADLWDEAREAGANDYLRKPVEPSVLLARLAALLPQRHDGHR